MKKTPLHAAHVALNAKMAEFADYDMPIQYPEGVMTEHNWTREHAGIFDVSHMGQIIFEGDGVVEFLEKVTPSTFSTLKENVAKYSVLTNEEGGMIDDLIVTRLGDNKFFAVVNGACKDKDIDWFKQYLPQSVTMTHLEDRALIALQGPKAEKVLKEALDIDATDLDYMRVMDFGGRCWVSRLGYTGEDGFEISMPQEDAETAWNRLLSHDEVKPVGLAARDSLRLEMGYPLYGHDIDATTSPVEADSTWIMGKKQNTGFIGNERVMKEIENGAARKRVGIRITGKGVAREGTEIFDESGDNKIGVMTSGGFSPTLQQAIGMAYIETGKAASGSKVIARVRGRDIEAEIADLPFVQAKTKKAVKKAA
jgi:aminomethyltransferase